MTAKESLLGGRLGAELGSLRLVEKITLKAIIIGLLLGQSHFAMADDREDALFGDDASVFFEEEPFEEESSDDDFSSSDAEDDLFGDGASENSGSDSIVSLFGEKLKDEDSRFDIGGRASFSSLILNSKSDSAGESSINNSAIVDLYFDANLEDDIRFF